MISEPLSRKKFSNALQQEILPRVADKSAVLVPAHPLLAACKVRVYPQDTPLLRAMRRGRNSLVATHWVEEGFNTRRYPTFIWVAEGEADFRLGITRRMVSQNKKLPAHTGSYIVALPTHSFFLVPPDVPFSDASRPHWERAHLQDAHSRLLWFRVLPDGISIHTCDTSGDEHTSSRSLFLREPRLLQPSESVLEELQATSPQSEALAQHYLMVFLLHVQRVLSSTRIPIDEDVPASPEHYIESADTAIERARSYIASNLSQKLTLTQIASYAHVSPSHLNRLFRAQMKMSVGDYLVQRRIKQARSLLETTDLPMQRVAVLCGYQSHEHFTRTFVRTTGVTPTAFRRHART